MTVKKWRRLPIQSPRRQEPAASGATPLSSSQGEALREQVEKLTLAVERMNLDQYTTLLQNRRRLFWVNFLAGSARGLGVGFGLAVLSAGLLYILRGLMLANLPVIGDFLATIVRLVEHNLRP